MRQGAELAVGVLYRLLQSLCGQHWGRLFASPTMRFAATTGIDACSEGTSLAHDINGIICTTHDLDHTIPSSDPTLARYARQHLETLLARPKATVSDKVRELVSLQLASGPLHCRSRGAADRR